MWKKRPQFTKPMRNVERVDDIAIDRKTVPRQICGRKGETPEASGSRADDDNRVV